MDFLQLRDKRILVVGVANRKSVAFHVGRVLTEAGANVIYSVRSEERRKQVAKLLPAAAIHVCDFERQEEIDRLRDTVAAEHGALHGLLHSVAFADYSAGWLPFHQTPRA